MFAAIGMFSDGQSCLQPAHEMKLVLIIDGVHTPDTDLARVYSMQGFLPYLETALNLFLLSIEGDRGEVIELHRDDTLLAIRVRMRDDFPFA